MLLYGVRLSAPRPNSPTWRAGVSLFIWAITFDLPVTGDPTRSYATASIAVRIISPLKTHCYVKGEILLETFTMLDQYKLILSCGHHK